LKQLELNFINQICQDLEKLNGTKFEYLSKEILSIILDDNVNQKGHNLYAKPVKSTADFNTNNFEIIGQCGTDNNYFNNSKKSIKDIESAIKNHSQSKIIYLFANKRGTGGQLSELNKKIVTNNYTQNIKIYDSEKISNIILQNILNQKIEKLLKEYLPTSYEIYKLLPQANNIPKFTSRKYFERDIEDDIIEELLNKKILQIFGISGLGKTEVVKSICTKISNNFESSIWIDGSNSYNFNFESVHIEKFNSNINLKTLLENHKVILILDNFNENLNELKQQFDEYNKKDSVCLITSLQQNLPNVNAYRLNYLSDEISKNILFETENKPSNEIANDIIKYINGYPLLLNIIRDNIENEDDTWEEILEDIKNIIQIDDPEKNKKISIIVLEKQLNSIEDDIKWIFLLESRFISKEFLKFCIKKAGIKRLIKRSIISDTDSSFYTIHQILLDSIIDILKNKVSLKDTYLKLDEFLTQENENKSVGYFNFLLRHNDFIVKVYNSLDNSSSLKKQILYSKIQVRNESDEVYFLEEIKNFTLNNNEKIDVLLLVEKIEIELYQAKKDFQKSDEKKYIKICRDKINLLEELNYDCNIENIDLYLNHHLGKIYSRIREYPKALELFEKVIAKDNNADYAQLQIARILSWDKENNNSDKLKKIFDKTLTQTNKWKKQSLSVLLAMYDILSKNNMSKFRKEYIDDNIGDFVNRLFYSLSFGFEQPFQLLSNLSSYLSYNQKDIYYDICENLPLPSTIETNDNIKFAFATIQVAYYKNLKYSDSPKKNEKMKKAFEYAEIYYKSIDLDDYQRGKFVDLYIENKNFSEALEELDKYQQKNNAFYFQKLSKTYRGLKQYDKSLEYIGKAIKLLGADGNKNYLSAFLNDKAETLKLKGEIDKAIGSLKQAIDFQTNSKTKDSWNIKLTNWQNS
jgi:tetratricopeptide (TPR) repeat protein